MALRRGQEGRSEQAPPARVGHGGSQEQGAGSEGGKSSRMAHGQGRGGRTFGGTRRPGSEDRVRRRARDSERAVSQRCFRSFLPRGKKNIQ